MPTSKIFRDAKKSILSRIDECIWSWSRKKGISKFELDEWKSFVTRLKEYIKTDKERNNQTDRSLSERYSTISIFCLSISWRCFLTYIHRKFSSTFFGLGSLWVFFEFIQAPHIYSALLCLFLCLFCYVFSISWRETYQICSWVLSDWVMFCACILEF